MRTLNLGILAHIDAGKTSLTERLLHAAGVIDEIGSVDAGSTQTDSLALERQRGITIKSAVVSFAVDDVTVNLIDTPGHPDFIAEVERVLSVLDGAVLVVSAVEGVQAQTRVLMRTLQRLRIPTLIFVNKIDRRGADAQRTLRALAGKLTPAVIPAVAAHDVGTRTPTVAAYGADDRPFTEALTDLLTSYDDDLLAAYVHDEKTVTHARLRSALAAQTRRAQVHPVFFGSAITGAGMAELTAGIKELLPAPEGDPEGPVSGTVFKVERGPSGEKIAYVRMLSGAVRVRDAVRFGQDSEGKVTAVSVFDQGAAVRGDTVPAGRIGKLWGLGSIRIGDHIGDTPPPSPERHHFAPPTLETVVVPARTTSRAALHSALTQLAEQDPLINLRHDELRQEISVSLYGEVQKEVIGATLADEYGIDVTFRESTTICVERLDGAGEAFEIIAKEPNPFLATVGLRVEPAPLNSGVEFRLGIELGSMPYAFFRAVEDTVRESLHQGINGWQIPDCRVTMTHSGYWPRQSHSHGTFDKSMSSTAGDFRNLTPLILMDALRRAGTTVHEPMHHFRLEAPADTFGTILQVLSRLRAVPRTPRMDGTTSLLEGEIPAASVHSLEQQLPSLTRGEGLLESAFERYRPVTAAAPSRPRTDHNPLNRREYLLQVVRRVSGQVGG
ncbi:elongation factor G [Streptomyces beijiangensis]|uniref:TetM/TetW/TetO/TetS family tetracycline resistance ribosomal protection protein n=1 Tax=Streptomyces beijiangensis TaxID=163361 RepID=A0A939FCW8_9ACTN|nr:TetM/TetW/TetO/TetS family tetracycline resistance ribosomal protection protein [Streptomyces beijiangensis]MBO0515799.1 TetM/TetW/TetO/TetS family tetracycline resistance ribosomal protection protein [Streptomyces beijiangensis]